MRRERERLGGATESNGGEQKVETQGSNAAHDRPRVPSQPQQDSGEPEGEEQEEKEGEGE